MTLVGIGQPVVQTDLVWLIYDRFPSVVVFRDLVGLPIIHEPYEMT